MNTCVIRCDEGSRPDLPVIFIRVFKISSLSYSVYQFSKKAHSLFLPMNTAKINL